MKAILLTLLLAAPASAQVIFAAPANFGGTIGSGLFQASGGQVSSLNTGFTEHNFPWVSRSGRFVVFSTPDPITPGLQEIPSSDIYAYDRATGTRSKLINNMTQIVQNPPNSGNFEQISAVPTSAALSPNEQILAYGVAITRRQGAANPQTTKELNLANPVTGVTFANPTFGRGPVSDTFQAEFVGLSWAPDGNSFVTPFYVPVPGTLQQLPAIVRFGFNGSNWVALAQLSTPQLGTTSARIQFYPALSPSGTGLAYFDVFWPDALGASQSVTARLIVANSDGSNASIRFTFNQGTYPVGLAWAPDGNSIAVSIANQAFNSRWLAAADLSSAVVRNFDLATNQLQTIPGVTVGYFPSQFLSSPTTSNMRLQLVQTEPGQFRLTATGVEPARSYSLQSSTTLDPASFGAPQSFTGAQLLAGINVNSTTSRRFFILSD